MDNEYTTITLDDLYNYFNNNKPIPKKSVVLTFDDGYADNYTNMYPIMNEFGFSATVFIITNTVDKDSNYLTSTQLKEMNANGIDIESHTAYHDLLGTMSYEKQLDSLKDSKLFLAVAFILMILFGGIALSQKKHAGINQTQTKVSDSEASRKADSENSPVINKQVKEAAALQKQL